MSTNPINTGFKPLQVEFIPATNQKQLLSTLESWQQQQASAIFIMIMRSKYGCSDIFNFNYWAKTGSQIIIKIDPLEDPDNNTIGPLDRLAVQNYISDVRSLKETEDTIYFSVYSNDKDNEIGIDSVLMSFHIPDILPYWAKMVQDVNGNAKLFEAITVLAASYEKQTYKNLPKYNN